MNSTLLQIALVVAVLSISAVVTNLFTRTIYVTCAKCGTLNARRRIVCRRCGVDLREKNSPA